MTECDLLTNEIKTILTSSQQNEKNYVAKSLDETILLLNSIKNQVLAQSDAIYNL